MENYLYIIIPGIVIALVIIFLLFKYFYSTVKFESIVKLMEQKKYDEAIKILKKQVHQNDQNSTIHYYLGECYYQIKNFEWSLPHFKKVIVSNQYNRDIDEANVRERLADIYLNFQQLEEAQKELLMILKLKPENYKYYFRVGLIFYQRFYKENAAVYFKKALELNPAHPDSLFYLGEYNFEMNHYSDALNHLKACLRADSSYHKAHFYLGMIHYQSKNFAQAIQEFEKSMRDPLFRLKACLYIGKSNIESGNNEKGIIELERALQYISQEDNTSLALRYQLASIYEKTRDIPAAIEQWEKINQVNPNYQEVAKKLNDYKELRMDDALKDFMTATESRFEALCNTMTNRIGLEILESKISNRGTIASLLCAEKESEFRNVRKIKIYVKIYRISDKISDSTIREILEEMKDSGSIKCVCITATEFTRKAADFAESRPIQLFDKTKISDLIKVEQS